MKAASQLLCALDQAQKRHKTEDETEDNKEDDESDNDISCCDELKYSIKRLVKGLASTRKGARQGFATVLTEILSEFACLCPEKVLKLIAKNLEVTGSAKSWEERDSFVGQVFGLVSVLRSQFKEDKITSSDTAWLSLLIARVRELSKKKTYLQELCAKVIVDIFEVVSTDVFVNCVYPSVKEIIEGGWAQATPETLLISLALQRCWGDHLERKLIKSSWKCSYIADKKNYERMAVVLQDSISSHPRVHCVWDEVFLTLFDNPASDVELFWNKVVEDGLFQSTQNRKFLGFQLVRKILPQISAKQVPILFSAHMMRSFINGLSSPKNYLHEAAKQLASSLPVLVNENRYPEVPNLVLQQLLGRYGNMQFDKLTKTKTVENMLGALQGSGADAFVSWLFEVFEQGALGDSGESESRPEKNEELARIAVLNQLFQLVKKKNLSHKGDWVQEVLFFFIEHAYFQPIEGSDKLPLTSSVRRVCEQRFISTMKDLSSSKEMKQENLYKIVLHAKKLLESDEHKVVSEMWTDKTEKAFRSAVKVIEKIQKKGKKRDEGSNQEDKVFELLFCHMALQLFTEPEQVVDILQELKACYEKQKSKSKKEDGSDEPHWVEVLTEVLLSLLTRPSSLFRHVVDHVFTLLAPHLTLNALNMILESFRKGGEGETLEIVDESADEGDEEDMEDEEGNEKETVNSTKDDTDSDVEEDDEEGSSSDEEQDASGDVDEAFRAELQAALGPAVVDVNKEGNSSDEDLDDEAMMQLDDALAAVFKTQLQAKKEKNKKIDATKIVLHFKLRVLDIIEIFIKKQASNPLVLELIEPLLDAAWSSLNSKNFRPLGEKAQGLFTNKLCTLKELPPVSALDPGYIHDKIDHLVEKAMSAPSSSIVTLVSLGFLYLIRVLRGSRSPESTHYTTQKGEGKTNEDIDKTKGSLLDAQRLSAVLNKALKDFMEKRSTHLHPVLFTELINRFPHLGWCLAPNLVKYLESAVNNFRKCQACAMLMQLMSQKTQERTRHIKEIAPSLQTTLNSLLSKAATSDTELKAKHVRELLKLTTKFINEAKKTENASAFLENDKLMGGVTQILDSELFKKSSDIKSTCSTIRSILTGSNSEKTTNQRKNKKRKLEETEGKTFQSSQTNGGTELTETGSEDIRKRKKKQKN